MKPLGKVLALLATATVGGLGHRALTRHESVPEVEPPSIPLAKTSSPQPELPLPSLADWLAQTEADPLAAAPLIVEDLAKREPTALANLAEQWAALDKPSSLSLAERLVHDALFFRWAEIHPRGLLAYLNRGPKYRRGHTKAAAAAIVRWALRDPSGAFQTARALHDPVAGVEGVNQAIEILGPKCAAALLEHLALVEMTDTSAVSKMLGAWASESPQAALAWLKQLKRPKLRQDLQGGFYYAWAKKDPKATAMAAMASPPSRERRRWLQGILYAWAESDPPPRKPGPSRRVIRNSRARFVNRVSSAWGKRTPWPWRRPFETCLGAKSERNCFSTASGRLTG